MRFAALHRGFVWAALGTAILVAIVGTPFLLRWAAPAGMDWGELSNISQTYTAISAPLTAAALLGAVVSLMYQARQARVSQEEATSAIHRELLSRSVDDADLAIAWGPVAGSLRLTRSQLKQFTYTNMIINFWHSDYILSGWRMSDEVVKFQTTRLFQGEVGREFWALFAEDWHKTALRGRRSRRFLQIVDQSFEAAQAAGPAVAASDFYLPDQAG